MNRGPLRRLLPYAAHEWPLLAAMLVALVAGALLELAIPWVMGFALFDGVIARRDLSRLPRVIGLLAAIFVAQKVCGFAQETLHELANQRLIHHLRRTLFEHLQRLPIAFFDRRRTGELLSRTTSDVDTVDGLLQTFVQDIVAEFVTFVGTIVFLSRVQPSLTLMVLPTIAGLAASVFLFKKTVKRYARRVRATIGELAALAAETISGVRVVKAFVAEAFEAARFAARSQDLVRMRVRTATLQSLYSSTVDLWVFAGTVIVILVATPWVVAGSLTVGGLVAYLAYLAKLYGPAKKLSKVNVSIQKILASADRIFEILDHPVEPIVPAGSAEPVVLRPRRPRSDPAFTARSVHFDRVTFAYEPGTPVLSNVSFRVDAGDCVAIVGRSGAGKSTLTNLLLGFYTPASGRILIDDAPLGSMRLPMLRREIGLVSQDVFLFSGTIQDNIAYAQPDVSRERVVQAARTANAHEFIEALPGGYDAHVGERAVNLSGGQRQRLAIARALVRDPRILIFDEATSHLDAESERQVLAALESAGRGRTVIIIAHRLSTIAHADRIFVLDGGAIVQSGTHGELVACDGLYRRLHALQSGSTAAWAATR